MTNTPTTVPPAQAVRLVLTQPLIRVKLVFLLASLISLLLSVSLWFSGNELQGIFVGVWVPSILSLGALVLAPNRAEIR